MVEVRPFDPAELFRDEEDMVAYLAEAAIDGDPELLKVALSDVLRARGMTRTARETGLSRESLYRAMSPQGNPTLDTLSRTLRTLGAHLTIVPDSDGQTTVPVTLPPASVEALRQHAERQGTSTPQLISDAVDAYLRKAA